MFAPKANRRPSQSRASLKTQEKHKFTKREKIDYGGKSRGPRTSVEFLAHSSPRLLDWSTNHQRPKLTCDGG